MGIKVREYDGRIQTMGFERATRQTVAELIEENNDLERNVIDMAMTLNKMVDLIGNFNQVGEKLKEEVSDLRNKIGNETDAPPAMGEA